MRQVTTWFVLTLICGAASLGCSVTRYVYVGSDGQQYVYSSPPADATTLSDLHPVAGGTGSEGAWATELPHILPGDSPHQIIVRVEHGSTTMKSTYWAAPPAIV